MSETPTEFFHSCFDRERVIMTSPSTYIPDNPYIQIGLLVLIIISQIAQWVRKNQKK